MQVDLKDPKQLVTYFSNPAWEAALQRTPIDIETALQQQGN